MSILRGEPQCDTDRGRVAPLAASFAAEHADALSCALQTAAQYLGSLSLREQSGEPGR